MSLSKILPASQEQYVGARNIIINGNAAVSQRGTNSTGQTGGGYKTCDRFQFGIGGIGTYTITQSTDAPDGFANSLKVDCTVADASPTGSDRLFVNYAIEGQDVQHLKKGTSAAKQLTLSFWVRSNKTGVGNVNLRDSDNTRMVGGTYTISTADTWEYKTVTYPADTTGALDNDNSASLRVEWWLDSGSDYNSGTTPAVWEAESATDFNASGTLDIADSTSNEWYITGVQLEIGEQATPFEHESYAATLQKCERYYNRIYDIWCDFAVYTNNGRLSRRVDFPTTMRANPSMTRNGVSSPNCDGITSNRTNLHGTHIFANSTGATADAYFVINNMEADAEL